MLESILASLFTAAGGSTSGPSACPRLWIDEPEMPKSMIEK